MALATLIRKSSTVRVDGGDLAHLATSSFYLTLHYLKRPVVANNRVWYWGKSEAVSEFMRELKGFMPGAQDPVVLGLTLKIRSCLEQCLQDIGNLRILRSNGATNDLYGIDGEAFEWESQVYVTYPYFWADALAGWSRPISPAPILRSPRAAASVRPRGGAATPGFEALVNLYEVRLPTTLVRLKLGPELPESPAPTLLDPLAPEEG